jgi:hypothetical protein
VERRPGASEEWLATTKHDGAEVQSVLIDKTGFGQALRQGWSANVNLARQVGLEACSGLSSRCALQQQQNARETHRLRQGRFARIRTR